ncbi:MOV10 [Lepeophtheirus salmonis]|uniref:MOV10 n=1 Tax=Lepeophtheirus salmonis TaxID=72036 RepID=A0A7R8CBY9_LEPSM|nr:MOV10 [Lepeophtheirus salmonis]CAF2763802.1 MOV10 [Lepeophtheirus salmonis]
MIEHILGFSSYPFPYIIFGPPGTGKSSTVAEAIKQVHHDPKKTRILVCAPSNTAVDVVTEKILDDISPCSVLHVVAARHKEKYDSKTGPFKESLQIGGSEWQIYQRCEPECLLAIKPHLNHALIVLSGDHYQLGPVVLSQNTFGLTISLMERLMTCDPYYMRGSGHTYNPKYVTKLVDKTIDQILGY